jgi:subtilisin-like proprotein convertase family protein
MRAWLRSGACEGGARDVLACMVAFLLACFAGLVPAAHAQVFTNSTPVAIESGPTAVSTINVTGGPTSIANVGVVINISHPWVEDLDIVLIPPASFGGQYIHLSSDNGGSGDNYRVTRFDNFFSTTPIVGAAAPFNGTFLPEGGAITPWTGTVPLPANPVANLLAFNGRNANGTWTLLVEDDFFADQGKLISWSLEFNGQASPLGPHYADAPIIEQILPTRPTRFNEPLVMRARMTSSATPPRPITATIVLLQTPYDLPNIALLDNGVAPDLVAGDGIFSGVTPFNRPQFPNPVFLVGAQDSAGAVTVSTLSYSVTQPVGWIEVLDGGDDTGSASEVRGSTPTIPSVSGTISTPSDVDIFEIRICQPTVFSAQSAADFDTQLFLFNSNAVALAHSDDDGSGLNARITNIFVPSAGVYYLAVSSYDVDPIDSASAAIWTTEGILTERAPDGPSTLDVLNDWRQRVLPETGQYNIFLNGVCPLPGCDGLDFNNDGLFPDTEDINDFLRVFSGGTCSNAPNCSDIDFNNDGLFPDTEDINDFLRAFAGGPCP